jgi:hypothetical protein
MDTPRSFMNHGRFFVIAVMVGEESEVEDVRSKL